MKSITIQTLCKQYGLGPLATRALIDVDLHIAAGEFFFLLGPSGCGKTTLLRILAGLIDPSAGRIFFDDEDVTDRPVEKRSTAMVFQNYALWPHMTVRKNVEFGPKMRGLPAEQRREIAQANLRRVELQEYGKRKPNQLSGGQQQRVALARALSAGADCLLFDEPLSNLDARLRATMREELRQLVKSTGATAVYVTHDQKEALSMADRIAVMHAGRVVQIGTPEDIYRRPATKFIADFIGEANFLPCRMQETREDGVAHLDTSAGPIRAVASANLDGELFCCVRPEAITIRPDGESTDESPNALPATIERETYLGELRQYRCALTDGTAWRVSMLGSAGEQFAPGRTVRLCFAPTDAVVVGP
jgi:ABC-type Fe3+/spermidine/putrescine transport system ATPase subunit